MNTIGDRLKLARLRKDLTQVELAKKSGVKRGVIVKIELGNTQQPKLKHLIALARALGISPVELQFGIVDGQGIDSNIVEIAKKFDDLPEDKKMALKTLINSN